MVTLMSLKELLPAAEQVSTPPTSNAIETRRRPGRLKEVSPELVPLLRSPATADIHAPALSEADARFMEDDLAAVKGIMYALALSVPLWAGISAVVGVTVR